MRVAREGVSQEDMETTLPLDPREWKFVISAVQGHGQSRGVDHLAARDDETVKVAVAQKVSLDEVFEDIETSGLVVVKLLVVDAAANAAGKGTMFAVDGDLHSANVDVDIDNSRRLAGRRSGVGEGTGAC